MQTSSTQPAPPRQHADIPEHRAMRTTSETPYFAYVFLAALVVIAAVAATGFAATLY